MLEHISRRIVAMEREKRDWQLLLTLLPVSPLREQTVRDVAECTVPHSETSPDPVRDFTNDSRVGVVHTNELCDDIVHDSIVGSVAVKVSVQGDIAFGSTDALVDRTDRGKR
jgi:hypothetical protein